MDRANRFMDGFGVEVLRDETKRHYYFTDIRLLYVNMGGSYDLTFMYDVADGWFSVGSWGDWMEAHAS
jgi:hypothetical protein